MIRDRVLVPARKVVAASYSVETFDGLVAQIKLLDSAFTAGLCDSRLPVFDWEDRLSQRDPRAFQHVLGSYSSSMQFEECLHRLSNPAFYVNSGGYPIWAAKSLVIHAVYLLRGIHVFGS